MHPINRIPWWKRLWNFLRRKPVLPETPPPPVYIRVPAPIRDPAPQTPGDRAHSMEQLYRDEIRTRLAHGTEVTAERAPRPMAVDPGAWKLDRQADDERFTPLVIAQNVKNGNYALVFHIQGAWHFWTGPHSRTFITLGSGHVWATPKRQIAVITAMFMAPQAVEYSKQTTPTST